MLQASADLDQYTPRHGAVPNSRRKAPTAQSTLASRVPMPRSLPASPHASAFWQGAGSARSSERSPAPDADTLVERRPDCQIENHQGQRAAHRAGLAGARGRERACGAVKGMLAYHLRRGWVQSDNYRLEST